MATNNLVINFPRVYNKVLLEELEPGELFILPDSKDVVYMKTFPVIGADNICYDVISVNYGHHHDIHENNEVIRVSGTLNLEYMN